MRGRGREREEGERGKREREGRGREESKGRGRGRERGGGERRGSFFANKAASSSPHLGVQEVVHNLDGVCQVPGHVHHWHDATHL